MRTKLSRAYQRAVSRREPVQVFARLHTLASPWIAFATAFVGVAEAGTEVDEARIDSFEIGELEGRFGEGREAVGWDVLGQWGSEVHAAVFESEGGFAKGPRGGVEVRFVYARRLSDAFDVRIGGRFDWQVQPGPDVERGFAVLALVGTAPLAVEVDAELAISDDADVSLRVGLDRSWMLTERIEAVASAEFDFEFQDVRATGNEAGPSATNLGLRVHYDLESDLGRAPPLVRSIVPYIGFEYSRALADSADLARAQRSRVDALVGLAGVAIAF